MDCDVLVAGGGSAGLAAAVAAARLGAKTMLVERHGVFGGMAPAALIHSICGLYRLESGGAVLANDGFAAEFARRLVAAGGASGPVRMGRVDVLLQRPIAFAALADEIVRETPGLSIRLHTEIVQAEDTVRMVCRGRTEEVRPKALVDATGDAVLATLRGADCEMEESARLQRPAYVFALGGVAADSLNEAARLRLAQRITQAVKEGNLPGATLGAHLRASGQMGEAFVTVDLAGGPNFDPLDAECLSYLEILGREVAGKLAAFLRAEISGFSECYISAWPSRVGVRESRRIVGRYRLETQDLLRSVDFPDTVAYASWPMELRETATGPKLRFPENGLPGGIPLRSLRSRDDETLFAAGRCISCSHGAQASIRVIGTCLATGEAAGLAAALQVLHGEKNAAAVRAAREKIAR